MKRVDLIIGLAALSISISVHAAILIKQNTVLDAPAKEGKKKNETRLSFKMVQPPPPPKEKPKPEPIPPKLKPKPVPKPKVKPPSKPVLKPIKEMVVPEIPAPVLEASLPQESFEEAVEENPELVEEEKRRIISAMMECVEKCKFYPRMARRRRIEGVIKVSCRLMGDGKAENIKITGDSGVLCRAAEEAVKKALPIPVSEEFRHCPLDVEFEIEYALK